MVPSTFWYIEPLGMTREYDSQTDILLADAMFNYTAWPKTTQQFDTAF